CAFDGVDRTAEIDQKPVPGDFEDAALVLCDQRLQHFLASLLQGRQCAGLVLLHESAIADHIGSKNGGEPALGGFFCHVAPLPLVSPMLWIVWTAYCRVYRGPDVRLPSKSAVSPGRHDRPQ